MGIWWFTAGFFILLVGLFRGKNTGHEKYYKGRARKKKNWTQADLAKHIGVSRQGLNSIETGKFIPSTLLALRMAKVFNTTVEVLFQLDDAEF
ncbi:helix-turn-helix transcriptional regulator [Dyadobacter pollutisoli]|uniref:Helix-turn-helix transcriptional regulator n=1 Tax=Dyadobacter pollutisoli TaxID=2910158 RepID=A0A9E8NF82_9BACT|nr:helix-turn-helix transcriptional regulator [Dyadobacter pollutisoli]WAC14858.1 helix-turn-helix transcriptional regulator [Dyadobacter pollutisoli]